MKFTQLVIQILMKFTELVIVDVLKSSKRNVKEDLISQWTNVSQSMSELQPHGVKPTVKVPVVKFTQLVIQIPTNITNIVIVVVMMTKMLNQPKKMNLFLKNQLSEMPESVKMDLTLKSKAVYLLISDLPMLGVNPTV